MITNGLDLSEFVDLAWDECERIVISYLKSFECIIWCPGIVWCKFRCKQKIGGPYFFDDGFYRWSNVDIHLNHTMLNCPLKLLHIF